VVEINGAVEFNDEYALSDRDVFELAVEPFVAAERPREAVDALEQAADRYRRKKNLAMLAQVDASLATVRAETGL
jgi:hypothetical protein